MDINLCRIGQVTAYIEENLKSPLTLDAIAGASGLSPYYLHRIFRALTGYPLVQYIRYRKLSQSMGELLDTQMSILDIAQEYGFEYQQSYSRAFKRHFHISPAQFRKNTGTSLTLTPRLDITDLRDTAGGILRLPVFVVKKGFNLVGVRGLVDYEEDVHNAIANQMGVAFFYGPAPRIPRRTNTTVYYGYVEDVPGTVRRSWYQPSVEVADLSRVPDGMRGVAVPTRRYAVFTYIGCHGPEQITFSVIRDLYRAIYEEWAPQSGEVLRDPFHIERIDQRECAPDFCRMDIYVPVAGYGRAR